jgi:hypothetical protein
MNRSVAKRRHIEEANIALEKRSNKGSNTEKSASTSPKDTSKKDELRDKLMNQLKTGK